LPGKNRSKKLSKYSIYPNKIVPTINAMALRIQKFLSQCGYCSRRKAEQLILQSRVSVNGSPACIGQCISTEDVVKVDSVGIGPVQRKTTVALMLNKPRGVLCTHAPHDRSEKTVFDFVPPPFSRERFLYCGRLDRDSQGMLILTNDGDLAHRLTHPRSNIVKIYRVTLSRPITAEDREKMLSGIESEGEILRAEKILELPTSHGRPVLEVHLKQGRKREIRRMIESCANYVHRLKRVQIGQLRLKNLAVGAVKYLSPEDIQRLFA
jgi:23S rRNA pseudouridine2605 synthase